MSPQHTYEEIRQVVIDILQRDPAQGGYPTANRYPSQFNDLLQEVGLSFSRRQQGTGRPSDLVRQNALHLRDVELVRDVFWDLLRQGVITLGKNSSNDNWPWFRLSHFGTETLHTLVLIDSTMCNPICPLFKPPRRTFYRRRSCTSRRLSPRLC